MPLIYQRAAFSWLVATVLLAVAPHVFSETRSDFTVGIVEANGNLVPVATYDGSEWSSPWPLDLTLDQNAPRWPNLPEEWHRGSGSLQDWTLWFENPGPSTSSSRYRWEWVTGLSPRNTAVFADGLVKSAMKCSQNLALSTDAGDLRSSLIECDNCCPEPKRGIATNGAVPPKLVERLEPEAELSQTIASRLTETFNALESEAIGLDLGRRQAIPLNVETAFRVREANSTIYYMEISRSDFDIERTDPRLCFSVLKSCVRTSADAGFTSIVNEFGLVDCDGKSGTSDTPVVYWEHRTGVDLLVRRLGYESEWFAILTIDESAVTERTEVFFRNTDY